ncbi:MAG: hypothetical protein ABW087_14770 [Candidatus Thiodiazotropha sp.]
MATFGIGDSAYDEAKKKRGMSMQSINTFDLMFRILLFIHTIIILVGVVWFSNTLSLMHNIGGMLFIVSGIAISLIDFKHYDTRSVTKVYLILAVMGIVASIIYAYGYWIKAEYHGASMIRVYIMTAVGLIYLYFSFRPFLKGASSNN